jgi:ubiquinol-cytochrome c reductase cytochrome b subunit
LIFTVFTFKYCIFFFFFIYLHILKALLVKSYHEQNQILWFSGITIFFLSSGAAFLGYVLPWGQMSLWGATVITNLITALPYIGSIIVIWVWGGFSISNNTLNRFFVLHVILPLFITGLVLCHILILHLKGSSSQLGTFITTDKIGFFPYYVFKDLFGLFFFFIILSFFLIFSSTFLVGHPDNYIAANFLVTPLHIVPEWYFLAYYAILRSIPEKLGGVSAMIGAMGIFILKKGLDSSLPQVTYFRPLQEVFFFFFIKFSIFKKFRRVSYWGTFFNYNAIFCGYVFFLFIVYN